MKIRKIAGAVVISTGLVLGMAGFAGATSGTIGYTGPYSNNMFNSNLINNATHLNNNNLNVSNPNSQSAFSGPATASWNTTGGLAQTGAASNYNNNNVSATVTNGGAGAGWGGFVNSGLDSANINTTGPMSNNQVLLNTNNNLLVTNNNNLNVNNSNSQTAVSGAAFVSGNTFGGSAITGPASNSNSSSTSLNVTN